MNNFNVAHVMNGLIDFIIHLRVDGLESTHKQTRKALSELDSSKQHFYSPTITDVFYRLTGKVLDPRIQSNLQIQITFKLISNQNNSTLASEIWELQWIDQVINQPSRFSKEAFAQIKGLLQNFVQTSSCLQQRRSHASSFNKKFSSCSMTYQVISSRTAKTPTFGYNKTEFCASVSHGTVECRVYSQPPTTLDSTQSLQSSSPNHQRKQSISTIGSSSELEMSPRGRKVSIYSYYDPDNDVTFLSKDELDLGGSAQIESMSYEEADELEQDFELVLTEQDKKLDEFRQSLKEFQLYNQLQC